MSLTAILARLAGRPAIPRRKKRLRPARFHVEALERRALLTIYTVTSTLPGYNGGDDQHLGLAEAIGEANSHPNGSDPDEIDFNIAGGGVQTIFPGSSGLPGLPSITDPVIIDATTQPGYAPGKPQIVLDGTQATTVGWDNGLNFLVGGNEVYGLVIDNFPEYGIVLNGANDPSHNAGPGANNTIVGCFIGTDPTGEQAAPNAVGGILLNHSAYNVIGGTNQADGQLDGGNLISGNGQSGVYLGDKDDTHNSIEGNYIGTDISGLKPIPNAIDGVALTPPQSQSDNGFPSFNSIGNFDPDSNAYEIAGGNIIAGNKRNGVYIAGGTGNLVTGNDIGLGVDGLTPIGNGEDGVRLDDASSNVIGGTNDFAGNVISANTQNGVEITASAQTEDGAPIAVANQSATGNVIQGNSIGTDESGEKDIITTTGPLGDKHTSALGNGGSGVALRNFATDPSVVVSLNVIGGSDSDDGVTDGAVLARNIISGNFNDGVLVDGHNASANMVKGNYIGTDIGGQHPLPNSNFGVELNAIEGQTGAPSANIIGDTSNLGGNLISGNGTQADGSTPAKGGGIGIVNGATANLIQNNFIGTDWTGLKPLVNAQSGVLISAADGNFIGGDSDDAGNLISGNLGNGVTIVGSTGNHVENNTIGTDVDEAKPLANLNGIVLVAASGNVIGGTTKVNGQDVSVGNVISDNTQAGIELIDQANSNQVVGNMIGTDDGGKANQGNGGYGVLVDNSTANIIGGGPTLPTNVISGNSAAGVRIQGTQSTINIVSGNYIGVTADGQVALPNHDGIEIAAGAAANLIGGAGDSGRNVISGNYNTGVLLTNAGAANVLANNFIGPTASGADFPANADGTINSADGVKIVDTPASVIGGATADARNVISGNYGSGIAIGGALSINTNIQNNYIGTDIKDTFALGNGEGVLLTDTVTGSAASATRIIANVISGNNHVGIGIVFGAAANHIEGNYIGTNSSLAPIPNHGAGIEIDNSPGNYIGGTVRGSGNWIAYTMPDPGTSGSDPFGSGISIYGQSAQLNRITDNEIFFNTANGVSIHGGAAQNYVGADIGGPNNPLTNFIYGNGLSGVLLANTGTADNVIENDIIGLNPEGLPIDDVGNGQGNKGAGVLIDGATDNQIGGGDFVSIISANLVGIQIQNQANNNNVVGNYIGTNSEGVYQQWYGNTLAGVRIVSSSGNTIGGDGSNGIGDFPGNTIAGNDVGVMLTDSAQHNSLYHNKIELNQSYGAEILSNSSNNQIGGSHGADGNFIDNNGNAGVYIDSGTGNLVNTNSIHDNAGLGIDLAPEGPNPNQPRKSIEFGPNNLQNYPVLAYATTGASHRIVGTLEGLATTAYRVLFFLNNADTKSPVQGQTPFSFETVTTNASGVASVAFDLSDAPLTIVAKMQQGMLVTATAMDPQDNTSEFSPPVTIELDSDGDGIPDNLEGTQNANNAAAAIFPNAGDGEDVSLTALTPATTLSRVTPVANPSPDDAPANTTFPFGLFSFSVGNVVPDGGSADVELILPAGANPQSYWRYNQNTRQWYDWVWDGKEGDPGAQIEGNEIILHFVDGQLGDDDGVANGTISDPGGPGFAGPFTVTTTADSGPGSLRQAILDVDADFNDTFHDAYDEITFDLPGAAPQILQPLSPLPAITEPVRIDGLKLPPSEAGNNLEGTTPLVEINGSLAGQGADGLTLDVGSSTVQGLIVDHFSGDGIRLESAGGANSGFSTFIANTLENNGDYGIEIDDVRRNKLGDGQPGHGNVISGNAAGGVYIHGTDGDGNSLLGNFIGVAADGVTPLANGGPGVLLADGPTSTQVGSISTAPGNTIAFNGGPGVLVSDGAGFDSVEANSIFSNQGLGIDLNGDGVTPNDADDSDFLTNFPVLSQVTSDGGYTYINGTLAGAPSAFVTLDFYASAAADPSGFGQGQLWLGSTSLVTDAAGQGSFAVSFEKLLPAGWFVTATATRYGTSEFSAAVELPPLPQANVYVVNTPDDVDGDVPDPAHFSLREAIKAANAHPGQDIIDFNLPDQTRTIAPRSPLPDITDPVIIDGTSQFGYAGLPLVELDGSLAGPSANGLTITGGGSTVRGLVIHSFQSANGDFYAGGHGIDLTGKGGNVIEGSFIGTDVTGTNSQPDDFSDVFIYLSSDNLVGGTTPDARNVLGSIMIDGYNAGTGQMESNLSGNRVEGNYIGTDVTGTVAMPLPNGANAVTIDAMSSNTIGGTQPGAGNVIVGTLAIENASSNVVQGNLIGTDYTGTVGLGRSDALGLSSVQISSGGFAASLNQIGGSTPAARNVIAGLVSISGAQAYDNYVQGNYIGIDITGTIALDGSIFDSEVGTQVRGIVIDSDANQIGGADPGQGNVISGGIQLLASAQDNAISGNRIGTDVTGTKALVNPLLPLVGVNQYGIWDHGDSNTIGGATPGAGNLISGNPFGGILLDATGDQVEGNLIGTDITGRLAIGNGSHSGSFEDDGGDGIDVRDASSDIIGGFTPGSGNVISGNRGTGIKIDGSNLMVVGNYIGTDVTGTARLGNGGDGISIGIPIDSLHASPNNVIGGAAAGAGNVIAANGGDGIRILDSAVLGDSSGNGIVSSANVIQGNKIGTDVTGTRSLGNAGDGISIVSLYAATTAETIGGADPGDGNLVAHNGGRGVYVPFGQGNVIQGNDIFANGGAALLTDINSTASSYAEDRGIQLAEAPPVLTSAVFDPQGTIVTGSLTGMPFTRYNIDFFANGAVPASGFSDAETYLETISILVDDSGTASFEVPLDDAVPVGQWITATATPAVPNPNTSDISLAAPVVAAVDASDIQFSAPTYLVTENGGAAVVTVTRTGDTSGTATVNFATSDGSASAETNYTTTLGTLTFNAGESSTTLTVPIQDDGLADGDKTFQIALASPTGASLGAVDNASVTIADRDAAGQVQFANSAFTVDRALDGLNHDGSIDAIHFAVTRSGGSQGSVTVDYRVTGGTAIGVPAEPLLGEQGDSDYIDTYGTLTFEDGQTTADVSVPYTPELIGGNVILQNIVYRGPQTIELTLGNPTGGATLGGMTTSTATVDDEEDRAGAFALLAGFDPLGHDLTKLETDTSGGFTIYRLGNRAPSETIHYATVDGTAKAGVNYVAAQGTVTFGPGVDAVNVPLQMIDDGVVDDPGTFQIVLSDPSGGAFIYDGFDTATVTILDADAPPSPGTFALSAGSVQRGNTSYTFQGGAVEENAGSVAITVQRGSGREGTVTVDYATNDGTAKAGVDYTATSGTLTFADGQTSATITVPILPDDAILGDKTFLVSLSNATGGATIDQTSGSYVVTIYQDQGKIQFSAKDYVVAESSGSLTATVLLDGLVDPHTAPRGPVEGPGPADPLYLLNVNYSTEDGTAPAGVRYTPVSGTLTFDPYSLAVGAFRATITIPLINNLPADGDQTFYLKLSDPTGGLILGPNAIVPITVLDEDAERAPAAAPTTTKLTSDASNGSTYGQNVTLTAVVAATDGTPTGSVDFVDQTTGQDFGSEPLAVLEGVDEASITVSDFSAASHTIVASYTSESSAFQNSQDTLVQFIAPATLTVIADDQTKIYGSANPQLTATITGFVNDDTLSVVTGSADLGTVAVDTSSVGDYPITAAPGTLSAANYTFAFTSGTLSITPATLTVMADPQTKIYGDPDPALTYEATGFKLSDSAATVLSGDLSRAAGETVAGGPYAIGQGTLSANTNYAISFTGSSLSITPATLTVTADDKTMLAGTSVPPLTDTVTGFVNGDPASVVSGTAALSTTATSASPAGTYPIDVTQGTLSAANYAFAFVNGTLTVKANPALVVLDPTNNASVTISGNGRVQVGGGNTEILSTSAAAIVASGNAVMSAPKIDVEGSPGARVNGNARIEGHLTGGLTPARDPALADPFAALPAPALPAKIFPAATYAGTMTATLQPGAYRGGISISGKAAVTLSPGLYYLSGGGLSVSGGSLTGDGVVIYSAPSGGKGAISITGQGSVMLTAPSSGPYQSIALFQDRASNLPLTVSGNGTLSVKGSLYAAGAPFDLTGDAQANLSGGALVVDDLNVSGNGLSINGSRSAALVVGDLSGQTESQAGPTPTAQIVTGYENRALTNVTLATFTAGEAPLPPGDFTAVVDWGDGTTSPASVTLSGATYSVSAGHTYHEEGSYAVAVTIGQTSPSLLASVMVPTTAVVHEELLAEGTTGTPDERYIQEIYRDLFGRLAEPQGREFWIGRLTQGASRGEVAYEITKLATAEEFQADTVDALYRQYLGRAPEPAAGQFWTAYLYSPGGTAEGMAASLIGSPEYYHTRGGGTVSGFLDRLFQDVLGRAIEPDAEAYFSGLLGTGHAAADIADMIFNSGEYQRLRVNGLYERFLDRPADEAGLAYFTTQMARGATDESLIAQILSTDEYFATSQE